MRHLVLVLVLFATIRQTFEQRDFTIENDQFQMDGKPFRIISGRYLHVDLFILCRSCLTNSSTTST